MVCVRSKEDRQLYAVKCAKTEYRSKNHRNELQREVRFLERFDHLNIVRFFGAWEEADLLYIQTELCERSLLSYIFDADGQLPKPTVWNILGDILLVRGGQNRAGSWCAP